MSQINFLPESFARAQRRRSRRPIEFGVIAATVLVLLVFWVYSAGPDRSLASQSDRLDRELQEIDRLRDEQSRLDKERSRLQQQLQIARETYQPISLTQVLARLSTLAPGPVRLVSFEMNALRPTPDQASGVTKPKPEAQPRTPNVMRISIKGQAPSDDEVVTLIRRLEGDPVFNTVALRRSKPTQTKTHYVREFELDLSINLDRRFVPKTMRRGIDDED